MIVPDVVSFFSLLCFATITVTVTLLFVLARSYLA